MTFEEMQKHLTGIQAELPETKILTAILMQQNDIDAIKKALVETQQKVNEIINAIESAATVNSDISEDTSEEDPVE